MRIFAKGGGGWIHHGAQLCCPGGRRMARSSERTQQKSVRATPAGTRLSGGPTWSMLLLSPPGCTKAIYCKGFGQQGVTLQHLGCISSVQCKVLQPHFFCHHLSCFLKPELQIYGKWVSFGAHGGALCRYSRKVLAPRRAPPQTRLYFCMCRTATPAFWTFASLGAPWVLLWQPAPANPIFCTFCQVFNALRPLRDANRLAEFSKGCTPTKWLFVLRKNPTVCTSLEDNEI